MDTTDTEIEFDEDGICNHCKTFEENLKDRVFSEETGQKHLSKIVEGIKLAGKDKQYDCIIGVSGGVDSTYVAYVVKKMGLTPLAVHFDNGWNSELAVSNIEKILKKLDIDLYTYVIDWEIFRDLQLAFLKASTPDGEIPTDHALTALLFEIANKEGIKYVIYGTNFRNEGIMPLSWGYGQIDWRYIKNVHNLFGTLKLKGFPHFGLLKLIYFTLLKRIKFVAILNYIDFNRNDVIKFLEKELGWRYYGGKHYESIYTRFYQSYVLPRKFNIDKRKSHLSCLICSTGEVSRERALEELKKETYDKDKMQEDKEYVIKKLELAGGKFEDIMSLPTKTFKDYHTNYHLITIFHKLKTYFRRIGILHK